MQIHRHLVALSLSLLACAVSVADTGGLSTDTETRIGRVQILVPPVLVKGETPPRQPLVQRMAELDVPGVSIAVMHQGRIDWARGFGVTRTGGAPVTADTLFQAASISKPVFALAVMHQVDMGKLDLDANVNQYLKDWKLPDNEFTRQKPVTLRQALTHSAGLTVHGFPGYAADAKLPDVPQILDGTAPANTAAIRVDMLPGSRWRYSGGGYVLSQLVLADATGIPLPGLLRDTVLAPLGMASSTFEQPLPATRLPGVAMPHGAGGQPLREGPHVYPELAAAGLWTTPADLARYALGVGTALAGESKVISAKTARTMLTPVIGQQGLGPQVAGSTARKFFTHGGANAGYRCLLVAYEDGEGAAIMTNGDRGDELIGDLMRTIAHVYQWPDFAPPLRTMTKLAPLAIRKFAGVYRLDDGSMYVVRSEGDQLVGNVLGNTPVALSPSSGHEFFGRDVDVVVDFSTDADGRSNSVRHRLGGRERNGTRVEEPRERVVMAYVEETTRRIKQQRAASGSDAAIRKLLAGLASGKPDYEILTPQMAQLTRQSLPGLQSFIAGLGELKGLTFRKVSGTGGDEYDADFERGGLRITLGLDEEGKIAGASFAPR